MPHQTKVWRGEMVLAGPSVLVVGGSGLAGGYIAAALLERPDAAVVLGARDARRLEQAAERLADKHGSDRVSTVVVDASDAVSLKRAVTGVDLVIVATQAKPYGAVIGRACLDAGADVIEISGQSAGEPHPMEQLGSEAELSGRCLVTNAGAYPGLPSFLVRLAAGRLDRLDSALVGCTVSNKAGWPEDTVAEVVSEIAHPPVFVWRNGEWRRSRLLGMADRRKFDFGAGWGRRACSPFFVEELRDLPKLFPSLQRAGAFISTNVFVDSVGFPIALVAMRLAPKRGHRPASRLVGWGMRRFARPPFGTVLKVEASGQRNGQVAHVAIALSHANEYEATGLSVAAFVAQWCDGPGTPARLPGLHPMGMVVEPERFLQDLADRGLLLSQQPHVA